MMFSNILGLSIKRLNRSSYFLSLLVSIFLFVGLGLVLDALLAIFGVRFDEGGGGIFTGLAIVAWYIYAPYCVIRRFHDLNMSGWWTLSLLVPFLNILMSIELLFFKGKPDTNKFGKPSNKTYILGLGI